MTADPSPARVAADRGRTERRAADADGQRRAQEAAVTVEPAHPVPAPTLERQGDAESRAIHRAEDAEERGEGICRTCLAPIWNEGGTIGRRHRAEGWSDRNERGGDSLVCFSAVAYRHVPLTGREACIYDKAYQRGAAA